MGESFCMYLPGMDDGCLEVFFEELSEAYPENHLLVVLDGAPSHRSEKIEHPENVSLLELPAYSPELDGGGEVVPRVQARVVERGIRERRSDARGAHPDARTLLGGARAPQTSDRIPLVGGSGGSVMTSIDRNSITAPASPLALIAHSLLQRPTKFAVEVWLEPLFGQSPNGLLRSSPEILRTSDGPLRTLSR
jgi:hypothetical protein